MSPPSGQGDILFEVCERATVTIEDWLQGRSPTHLSTNAGTRLAAFQAWRAFKEAFAPELVAQAFEETSRTLGRPIRKSIDPFGGSGTTALASQFLGAVPTTIEVNPYLADLIEAKLCTYDISGLHSDYLALIGRVRDELRPEVFPGAPATFVEPGKRDRFIFNECVARRLAGLRNAINQVRAPNHRRLFKVLLAPVAVAVSNVLVSGKGRRYRRNWQARQASPERVLQLFSEAFVQASSDIRRFHKRLELRYDLRRGDARALTPTDNQFDVAVFSPPYPNSFDYTDVYNVELWACGYLNSKQANRNLRLQTLRSHVQIKRNFESEELSSTTLASVGSELDAVREELWDEDIPEMVRAYFSDMNIVLKRLKSAIVTGGRIYLVVGDSRYHGIQVPVATILGELAENLGLKTTAEEPFRSMRASPQQGGRKELSETLLTLSVT